MTYYCDDKRHLVCTPYNKTNLHVMAHDLGIKQCWYHSGKFPHYDIPAGRIEEIKAKCIIVSSKEILKIIKGERK